MLQFLIIVFVIGYIIERLLNLWLGRSIINDDIHASEKFLHDIGGGSSWPRDNEF